MDQALQQAGMRLATRPGYGSVIRVAGLASSGYDPILLAGKPTGRVTQPA
jgi:hypothetical protein